MLLQVFASFMHCQNAREAQVPHAVKTYVQNLNGHEMHDNWQLSSSQYYKQSGSVSILLRNLDTFNFPLGYAVVPQGCMTAS